MFFKNVHPVAVVTRLKSLLPVMVTEKGAAVMSVVSVSVITIVWILWDVAVSEMVLLPPVTVGVWSEN